jgi:hypothetical protein
LFFCFFVFLFVSLFFSLQVCFMSHCAFFTVSLVVKLRWMTRFFRCSSLI